MASPEHEKVAQYFLHLMFCNQSNHRISIGYY